MIKTAVPKAMPVSTGFRAGSRSISRTLGLAASTFLLVGLGSPQPSEAQAGTCDDGWYKLCDGDCPPEHTDQGECTTRLESVGGTTVKWCCCPDEFDPYGSAGETTPGGPPGSIGECPDDGGCPQCPDDDCKNCSSPWAVSAAVARTDDPGFTDQVLYLIRDNILKRNPRGMRHVDAVYRYSEEVDRILASSPELLRETTRLLRQNLWQLLELGNRLQVTVTSEKLERASALLEGYSSATTDPGLKRALARARKDLRDRAFLRQLGIRVAG